MCTSPTSECETLEQYGLILSETAKGVTEVFQTIDVKPFSGLLIFVWNTIFVSLGSALAYVSIGAHLYMIGSIVMVFALMRRRKHMLSKEEEKAHKFKIDRTKVKKHRHHTDLVDDQRNLLIDFGMRHTIKNPKSSSSGGANMSD